VTLAQPTDLQEAYAALSDKALPYSTLWNYYLGRAPLVYSNARLAEVFRNLDAKFTENWAAVVVDSVSERLSLTSLGAKEAAPKAALEQLWEANQLALVADDVHEAALVCGESFVIAWPNEAEQPRAYYNDPRMCHVFYDEADPYVIRMAAKWYDLRDKRRKLTLYYPDRLEYYLSTKKAENITSAGAFEPDDPPTATNPYGAVPVFHFRSRRDARSELDNVVPIQNGINKLLADMIVAAEYGAYRQRWIISNADVSTLKNAPNEIWQIPAGEGVGQGTQVGEFSPTDLGTYLDAIDRLASHLATITRTPKHYFIGQGGAPSGEALIAMESPLNKKCANYIQRFEPVWKQLGAFMLKLSGQTVAPAAISVTFERPETVQPATQAQIRAQSVSAGVPLVTELRREGWTDAELEQMRKDQDEQAGKQQASLASALVAAQRQMDGGQPSGPTGEPAPIGQQGGESQ
jgi:hypothetical protein